MEYVTKEDHKEDLKTDRRVTRAEADIVHTDESVKAIDADLQSHKDRNRTEFRFLFVFLVGLVVGLFYFVHQLNIEMQRQFGEMQVQLGETKHQISAVRSDVADNRRLIEANSTQLESLRSEVRSDVADNKRLIEENSTQLASLRSEVVETNKRIDKVNDRLDNVDDRLAVVENVLSIEHQTSAYYKTGKL